MFQSRTWSLCKSGEYRAIAAEAESFIDTWKCFKSNNTVISFVSPASMHPYLLPVWKEKEAAGWNLGQSWVSQCSSCACAERVMSGDSGTLSWRSVSESPDMSPTVAPHRDIFPVKIIKVCFLSNSANMGKNFKLVRCEEGWMVKVQ